MTNSAEQFGKQWFMLKTSWVNVIHFGVLPRCWAAKTLCRQSFCLGWKLLEAWYLEEDHCG